MCRSMVDIHSAIAKIRREKKIEETTWQKYNVRIGYEGGHNKLAVTRYVENVHHWQEHEHASLLAISQLCRQSSTAASLATHAADAVAAHQYYESDSDVIFPSEVK